MRNLKDGQGYELRRFAPAPGAVVAVAAGEPAPAELFLYDVIGEDLFGGISARKVVDDLKALGPVPVNVRINSPGGDVWEGIAVYNALVRHSAKVTVHVDGIAASVASVVAMAGDRVVIAPNAMMMIHHASTWAAGGAAEMRRLADVLDQADQALFGTYAARSGRKASTFLSKVDAEGGEWWLSAEQARAEGLADEVLAGDRKEKLAALLDPSFRMVPREFVNRDPVWVRPSGSAGATPAGPLEVDAPRVRGKVEAPAPAPALAVQPVNAVGGQAQRRRVVEVLRSGS